jgi:hypothetical protein
MLKTPASGSSKFMMLKTDFFISPAYWVPAIRISFRVKSIATAASGPPSATGSTGGTASEVWK